MGYKFDKNKIKENLTIDQIKQIATYFGAEPEDKGEAVIMKTICHNKPEDTDRKKLYYYDNTKLFRCYTSCGDAFDIFELICRVKKIQDNEEWNLSQALYFVISFFNISQDVIRTKETINQDDEDILRRYDALRKKGNEIDIKCACYDSQILNYLSFLPYKGWIEEGITIDTMKSYRIKYYGGGHKIVIPHYDINNRLIGIRGRALLEDDVNLYGKYMPIKLNNVLYTHPLSFNLYGLNFNLANIQKAKKIIIFEGEKSVLLYDSIFGSSNNISVATCGHSISLMQIELILKYCSNVREVIIAYDKQFQNIGDSDFKKDVKLLTSLADKMNNEFNVSIMFDKFNKLDYKDSPIDKGQEVFQFLFENRILQGTKEII